MQKSTSFSILQRTSPVLEPNWKQVRVNRPPPTVIINILRGLLCRWESLRLQFANEPSIFVDGDLAVSINPRAGSARARRFGAVGSSPDFSTVFSRHLTSRHLNLSKYSYHVYYVVLRPPLLISIIPLSQRSHLRLSSIRTEDPTSANHVEVLTVWSVFFRMSIINILRCLPCRLESLRLKFTNEPSIIL